LEKALKRKTSFVPLKKININDIFPFIGLIFVLIFFSIVSSGKLLSAQNVRLLVNQMFTYCLGAIGCMFVVSQGNLDFSVGGTLGIAAAFAAHSAKVSPVLAIVIAIATGVLIGLINGVLHAKLKVESFVLTLAMQFVLQGVVVIATNSGTVPVPLSLYALDTTEIKLSVMIVVIIIGYFVFEFTGLGKYSKAIGSGIEATIQNGISVTRYKIIAFIISGGMAGLCSFFVLARTGAASTATGRFFETDVLIALILGGMSLEGGSGSKLRSAIIGSLILAVLSNGMVLWGINEHFQQLIKGTIFILAVWLAARNSIKTFKNKKRGGN
jgi:ribose transport system permease protein